MCFSFLFTLVVFTSCVCLALFFSAVIVCPALNSFTCVLLTCHSLCIYICVFLYLCYFVHLHTSFSSLCYFPMFSLRGYDYVLDLPVFLGLLCLIFLDWYLGSDPCLPTIMSFPFLLINYSELISLLYLHFGSNPVLGFPWHTPGIMLCANIDLFLGLEKYRTL